MKNIVSFLIAGAIFATVAFAQTTDAGAAARFQAKTGREAVAQSKDEKCCAMKKCCCAGKCCGAKMCHRNEAPAAVSHSDAEQRFFAKNGQYPPGNGNDTTPVAQTNTGVAGMQMGCCKRQS